jgi:hypothetical protein
VDVLSGEPVRGLMAWLWSENGSLLARDRSSGQATLFACSPGGKARLDAEALSRPGPYAIELRRESNTPKLLEQSPLAAGRLLASMVARGLIANGGQVGAPKLVPLSPVRHEPLPLVVPVGRCVDVSLALGPGLSGAEIRLIDTVLNVEVSSARGTYVTALRACALDRANTWNLVAELSAATGQGTGLVATRLLFGNAPPVP